MKKKFGIIIIIVIALISNEIPFTTFADNVTLSQTEQTDNTNLPDNSNLSNKTSADTFSGTSKIADTIEGITGAATGEIYLSIDNANCYEGMDRTYSDGYIPYVQGGVAYIILPVIASGQLENNTLHSSINLGDVSNVPFVYKNFEKTTSLTRYQIGENVVECYLLRYDLELKSDRINGTYPVTITVSGHDNNGSAVQKDFTVYVTITDGKNPEEENNDKNATEEKTVFQPVLLIESNRISVDEIKAGEEFQITTTIKNTSSEETVKNMSVTVSVSNESLELTNGSDKIYVGDIGAGEVKEITYNIKSKKETPQGYYSVEIQMSYFDLKATNYTDNGNVRFYVSQPAQIQFDPLIMATEAQVGDTITANIHAMNLGRSKLYNVRATLEADGLTPEGTIFIGDIEPGQEGMAGVNVSVWGLTKSESRYGQSEGKLVCIYEDANGNENNIEMNFTIYIQSPFTESTENTKNKDNPRQWWIIIAVLTGVAVMIGGYVFVNVRMRKRLVKV